MGVLKGVIDSSLPLADPDVSWSASDAIAAIKELATNKDGSLNYGVYKKAFFYCVDGGGDKQGDYKLPFATVINGDLKAVWNGVAAAMGALNGAQGGVDMPDADKEDVYHEIGTYYKRFGKDQPELAKSLIKREIGERVDIILSIDQTTVKDMGNGTFSCTVTTTDPDRMGESIDTQGIDYAAYMNNPVVLYGHDYQGLPIGKTTKLSSFKNKMVCQFQLAIAEYPFAATVAAMIKGGYLNAVSIGGIVKQWDSTFTNIEQMEMVEYSVVPVPANPNALITASFEKATGKSAQEVAKEFHEFVEKSHMESLKGVDNTDLKGHIESLKSLTAILEAALANKTSEKEVSNTSEKATIIIRKTAGKVSETGQQIIRITKASKE